MLEQAAQAGRCNQERWADEASYFDAVDYPTAPIHPLIVELYARCPHKDYFWSEYFFSLLSDVKGKHILDIGCGAGDNAVVVEPVNLSPNWRKLRLLLPVPAYGTADERPLEEADLHAIWRYLTDFEMRFFAILARLSRFFLHGPYELAPWPARLAYDAAVRADYLAVHHLGLGKLAASAVLSGRLGAT